MEIMYSNPMSKKALRDLLGTFNKSDGWLTIREGLLLYEIAKKLKGVGVIVEIGSWKGKSTICLGMGSQAGKRISVFAVDPHIGSPGHRVDGPVWTFDEFQKNVSRAGVDSVVIPIVETSEDAAKNFHEPVEFIFIDGDHSFESVKKDFEAWFPKVIEGGIIAFHDTVKYPDPRRFVEEYVFKSNVFKNAKFVDSITFAQKVSANSYFDRIKNSYVLFLKNFLELIRSYRLPKSVRRLGKLVLDAIQ